MCEQTPLKKLFKFVAAATLATPLMTLSIPAADRDGEAPAIMDSTVPPIALQADQVKPTQHMMMVSAKDIGDAPGKPQMLQAGILPLGSGFGVGPLTFAMPIALLGLASLPWFWRKMKTTPPKPRNEKFPPIHIIEKIKRENNAVQQMPLWHKMMRMSLLTMAITAAALPEFNPEEPLGEDGPVMLVIDNGYAAAKNMQHTKQAAYSYIDRADKNGRMVAVLLTSPGKDGSPVTFLGPMSPEDARSKIDEITPNPWPVDRQAARGALDAKDFGGGATVIWLSNGLDDGEARALAEKLMDYGHLTILKPEEKDMPRLLKQPVVSGDEMTVAVRRATADDADTMTIIASDEAGYTAKKIENVTFEKGQTEVQIEIDLPTEMKNRLARISIEGENSAGAVILLDERWRRRPVGLIRPENMREKHNPLLDDGVYIREAFSTRADFRQGSLSGLMERPLSVMVMTDEVVPDAEERKKIDEWVRNGGTLLRFAGPHLAARPDDDLLPVTLRPDARHMGGKLSGGKESRLESFAKGSPFEGITLPDNIIIEKEVLAQPEIDLAQKTWAQLDDGTPFVTADKRGDGWIVLVHSPANAAWTNLPLNGVFADMMDAVVKHSQGAAGRPEGPDVSLPPYRMLNGTGQLSSPPPSARALTGDAVSQCNISAQNPPGYYGTQNARYAHNLGGCINTLKSMQTMPDGVSYGNYKQEKSGMEFMLPLALTAAFLFAVDSGLRLSQQGRMPFTRRRRMEKSVRQNTAKPV